jgi:hypothetical protein
VPMPKSNDYSADRSPALDAYALSHLASEFGLSIDQVRDLVEDYGSDPNVLSRAIRTRFMRHCRWAASTSSRH